MIFTLCYLLFLINTNTMRTKIITTKKHLHLNLKSKWFDLILSGVKKQEYRDISKYWESRFSMLFPKEHEGEMYNPIVETIIFSNGYSKDRRQFEIEWIGSYKGTGRECWGAEKDQHYYVLNLGKILQSNC